MPRYIGYEFTGTANSTVITFPPASASVALLLNMDGADTSTSFPDNSINQHTVTAVGNAQVDTAQSKFGGASGVFDGTGDYLSVPAHPSFDLGTGAFTVEFWVRFNATTNYQGLIGSAGYFTVGKNGNWLIRTDTGLNNIVWNSYNGQTATAQITGTIAFSTATWYHVAVVRNGSTITIYVDGVSRGSGTDSTDLLDGGDGGLRIAEGLSANVELNGYIDDLRLSDVARYTTNFTPPTSAFIGGVPDRKYNSGVWSINGTDESSVYGRRIEGNWLTTLRNNAAAPPNTIVADVLIVGGGGGGGGFYYAGGGGAGGMQTVTGVVLAPGSPVPITVGAGGAAGRASGPPASSPDVIGGSGGNSVWGHGPAPVTSAGGGGGSGNPGARSTGVPGGSGGGGPMYAPTGGGTGVAGQGNPGGPGAGWAGGGAIGGGGGGGGKAAAGSAGTFGPSPANSGGPGGAGSPNDYTGSPVNYAGGGGGGAGGDPNYGVGGTGGGGDGGNPTPGPEVGATNTGGGGGGATSPSTPGGAGGSGKVVVRYPKNDPTYGNAPADISGGTKTQTPTHYIHEFNSTGTFTVP
jgi:hypothetical protein